MITVYGLLGEPDLELRMAAANADWVVGGRRHLDSLEVDPERRITLGALRPAIAQIAVLPESSDVVVIASGDPGYFGVVRSLRAAGLRPKVIPAPSAIATAFAAVGLPWDDAIVVSAHGRPLETTLNLARAHDKVAVFTSADNGIQQIAAGLTGLDRWYVLAERLGEVDERIRVLDPDQAAKTAPAEPNVVLILAEAPANDDPSWPAVIAAPQRPPRPSVSAAAAVAFARLLPEPGELLTVAGPLADEVAALARWAGAAVLPDPSAPAQLILTDDPNDLRPAQARAVVLTGTATPPPGYQWHTETIQHQQLSTGVPA